MGGGVPGAGGPGAEARGVRIGGAASASATVRIGGGGGPQARRRTASGGDVFLFPRAVVGLDHEEVA